MRVLAVTGGHRVELDAFAQMLDAICAERGWSWEHAVQPSAQRWLRPEHAGRFGAIMLHDIAGLHLARGTEPRPVGPDPDTRQAVDGLLAAGQGLVVTHHGLASWPAWDRWAHVVGGRYLYAPGTLDGTPWPCSGYRMQRHTLRVVDTGHPVCHGVDDFAVDDEVYLCPVFDHEVTALLTTDADLDPAGFVSTYDEVVRGRHDVTCVGHPPASAAVAWARHEGPSRIVYLQPGHGRATMSHPQYRRLLGNALAWTSAS